MKTFQRLQKTRPGPGPRAIRPTASRSAFTLVEMLVAVALVLLLMSLFAQVFQIAGSSISTQRGIMENDQRARSVQTLLKADLDKRTFRFVVPYALNEDMTTPDAERSRRRGYFSISENEIGSDTDDVLSLTVDASIVMASPDLTNYVGQALPLLPGSLSTAQQNRFFYTQANQPDRDDGRVDQNGTANSKAAEISYFVRGGNLYRRVLLIREPVGGSLSEMQPEFDTGSGKTRFFGVGGTWTYPGSFTGASNFWNDFDFSAHSSQTPDTSVPPVYNYNGTFFNGLDSLDMHPTQKPAPLGTNAPIQLAYPPNRFGHNYFDRNPLSTGGFATGGQPKEYTRRGTGPNGLFVGRFTQLETSDANFRYPQQNHLSTICPLSQNLEFPEDTNGNGLLDAGEDANGNGVLDLTIAGTPAENYSDAGPRRGEDILLTNVHAFDIKVYDEILQRFVDIGHSENMVNGLFGDYHVNNRLNAIYGPRNSASFSNRTFDTWYPFSTDTAQPLDFDGSGGISSESDTDTDGIYESGEDNGNGTLEHENSPPFRPLKFWPRDRVVEGTGRRQLTSGTTPDRWEAGRIYGVGSRIFPPVGVQSGDPFYYVCIRAQDGDGSGDATSAAAAPNFVRVAGGLTEDGNVSLGQDQLTWQAVDNRKPLKAIQITVRYIDPSTSQMRTVTIQQGLVD